ncbi:MAG: CoA transferase [Paracoccaceae bacterium]|nr:CoA transferase [Paracoccaceae bacterium]MDE2675274.1 CoA transferase [Paracoccaceae bacterium]
MADQTQFKPLEGIRVIEFSHMIFGPCCGLFLGLLGAEVIKIEPPGGDKTRDLTGMGASFFPTFNRGKKSVTIDMKTPEGTQAIDKLLASSDILIENFRDQSLPKMGLESEYLKAKYPELITVSCKGFLEGPYKNRSALDEVVQMMTGLAYMTGPPGNPLRIGSSANDIMGGLFGAYSAVAALREREQTGEGRNIRIGLFENSLLLVAQHMVQFEMLGEEPEPMPNRAFSWPVYDIFQTADGREIFVGAVTDGQWEVLCRILNKDDLLNDERLQTRMDQINARYWTKPIFTEAIKSFEFDWLSSEFQKVGIPYAPVARPAQMYDDPQAQAAGGLPISTFEDGKQIRVPGMPVEIDNSRVGTDFDIPGVGQDNNSILTDLGFDKNFIREATGQKV